MSSRIKISVITVVYNSADTIEDTIQNVLKCGYEDIEHIVIDGGSKDGTADIIKKYADQLAYWISEPDKGIYDAMNKGWEQVHYNRFVLFLGSGDKILQLPEIEDTPSTEVIYGDVMLGETRFRSKAGFVLKLGSSLHHQALLVRKSLHPAPPFNLRYKVYSDFDFNQRLLKKGARFTRNESLLGFALEGGVSGERNNKEMLDVVQANFGTSFKLLAKIYYFLQKLKYSMNHG